MIVVFEEIEAGIAQLVSDEREIICLNANKLPADVHAGDVFEIESTLTGWRVLKELPEEKEKRLEKSRQLREELKNN